MTIAEAKLNVPLAATVFAKPTGATAGPKFAYETRLSPGKEPAIVRRPSPAKFNFGTLQELPHYKPDSTSPFQVDLRGRDVSSLDLAGRLPDLLQADFDDGTRWPAALPPGFEPPKIMELGRNPDLGVRQLHRRGVTGKGIGIGTIADPVALIDTLRKPGSEPRAIHRTSRLKGAAVCGAVPHWNARTSASRRSAC
jgi:hypothetical protein